MTHVHRTSLAAALAILLALPAGAALAAEEPAAKPAEATVPAAAMANHMKAMHERMRQIQKAGDPAKRKELVAAQMKDMEAMMNASNHNCPLGEEGMGMREGKCGSDDRGARHDEQLERRVDALEQRLDMMQMMLMMQMRMGQGMPAMMPPVMMMPGMPGGMMVPALPVAPAH